MCDDDVARDELDEEANRLAQEGDAGACGRALVAVAAEALEREEHTTVIRVETLPPGERRGSRELAQHLPLARPADVELVEEGGDRVVVAPDQLQALERVVVELGELRLLGPLAGGDRGGVRHGRAIVSPPARG